ncbi:hypothetical protein [Acanthopleuribacter pedis]|uniref:Uncharacterized protein n=1 Tax=Acanthopleuribacter pedis TaxID=442870 RepID=A0A8J7QCW5_9BACT|nr:hypothetical protein [Acanthopleuribacter pedis]MBO1322197.1 hypothetical protein [Acanthopleuribacter pedis]
MNFLRTTALLSLCLSLCVIQTSAALGQDHWTVPLGEGFYKDALLNGGPGVKATPARHFEMMGLTAEDLSTVECDEHFDFFQHAFSGDATDLNGRLLYPDGSPRFRIMTVGGAAGETFYDDDCSRPIHDNDSWMYGASRLAGHIDNTNRRNPLGQTGKEVFQTFLHNGGSYSGFCAGAALVSRTLLHFYDAPNNPMPDGSWNWHVGTVLRDYFPSIPNPIRGGPGTVGGGTLPTTTAHHLGIDILASGLYLNPDPHAAPLTANLAWAYDLPQDGAGRLVVSGAHPEQRNNASGNDLTAAIYSHAIAGNGPVRIKQVPLQNGTTRVMDRETSDHDPEYTKIGDKQIHHFRFQVTNSNQRHLLLHLLGEPGYDFNLYLNKNEPAFGSTAQYRQTANGSDKTITPANLSVGTWYVGVELETTVDAVLDHQLRIVYQGALEVLNGIGYNLTATWDSQPIEVCHESIDNVTISSQVNEGSNTPIQWQAACFEAGQTATIELVDAGTDEIVRTLTNNFVLSNGANNFTWNVNHDNGTYYLRVSATQNTILYDESDTFQVVNPQFNIAQPSVSGQTLNLNWNWSGPNSTINIDLYKNGVYHSRLGSNINQAGGQNQWSWTAVHGWEAGASYRVRLQTLNLSPSVAAYSPHFTVTQSGGLSISGADVDAENGVLYLTNCSVGSTCSSLITLVSPNSARRYQVEVGNLDAPPAFVVNDPNPTYFWTEAGCRDTSQSGQVLALQPGVPCQLSVHLKVGRALPDGTQKLRLTSLDGGAPAVVEFEICINCR